MHVQPRRRAVALYRENDFFYGLGRVETEADEPESADLHSLGRPGSRLRTPAK
jgi:hypothetical protein